MSRKYGHSGYQDSGRRDDDRGSRSSAPPRQELTQEERIQKRSLRHAIDRGANEVIRCPNCGRNGDGTLAIVFESRCNHCAKPLHCCRTCKNFDSSARFQCRAPIETTIGDKNNANRCEHYAPRMVLDATGRRSRSTGSDNDPRSQFENLFKR